MTQQHDFEAALKWAKDIEDHTKRGIIYWKGRGDSALDAETCEERLVILGAIVHAIKLAAKVMQEPSDDFLTEHFGDDSMLSVMRYYAMRDQMLKEISDESR